MREGGELLSDREAAVFGSCSARVNGCLDTFPPLEWKEQTEDDLELVLVFDRLHLLPTDRPDVVEPRWPPMETPTWHPPSLDTNHIPSE